jgi:hypothetical protein
MDRSRHFWTKCPEMRAVGAAAKRGANLRPHGASGLGPTLDPVRADGERPPFPPEFMKMPILIMYRGAHGGMNPENLAGPDGRG